MGDMKKEEWYMKNIRVSLPLVPALAVLVVCMTVPVARGALIGTVIDNPGVTVVPGLVPPGTPPGTLLASLSAPFVSSLGTTAGTLVSAVYREAGGTLDFYYQVTNNLTAPNCGTVSTPCDPIARETDTTFTGFMTSLGFRTDAVGPFVTGTVIPVTGDRNSVGDVVGFSFNPPDSAKIQPGQISTILVISTNATNFTNGNASVIDGGVTTVAAFQPITIPEPGSVALLGGGLLALLGIRKVRRLHS